MRGIRILDRYVLKEFIGPFFAFAAGFTVMLVSGLLYEISELIFDKRMPAGDAVSILVYKMPQLISMTLPIAVLFAALLSLGRLSKDSEMTAMRSAGASFLRVAFPVFLAACAISAGVYLLDERIVPESNHRAQNLYRRAVLTDAIRGVEENVFFRGPDGQYFYVGSVDRPNRRMEHVLIYETAPRTFPVMLTAKRGTYFDRVWRLEEGVQRTFDEAGFVVQERRFAQLEYPLPDGAEQAFFGAQKTTDEMTRADLARHIAIFKRSGIDVRRFEVEYHLKAAMPLAGLLWILTGAPFSLRARRSGRFHGIVVSIVLALAYYVLVNVFRSLGWNGFLPPVVAAWATNAVFLAAGAVLLLRVEQAA